MEDRERKNKIKKMLIALWSIFIIMLAFLSVFVFLNWNDIWNDLFNSKRVKITEDKSSEISVLVTAYLEGLSNADDNTLMRLVLDPTQFNDMTVVKSRSRVITEYNNVVCYIVDGKKENTYIVFAVANITISGVDSTPLDIMPPFVIVRDEKGRCWIDNRPKNKETEEYIDEISGDSGIQAIYKKVKDDQEKCVDEDPTFKNFYEKLY